MPMAALFCLSLAIAFLMGVAMQRANACMVVAFDDLIYRRSATRILTIVSTWLMVPGFLALLALTTGFTPDLTLFPITVWSVVGGLLLGLGAVVTGACTGGVVARIGSGEFVFALTIVGFAAGCLLAEVFGPAETIHASAVPTSLPSASPVPALLLLVFVIVFNVRGLVRGRHQNWRAVLNSAWDPRAANIVLAGGALALLQIYGRPSGYPELVGAASRRSLDGIVQGMALFAALLAGAIVAGRTCTRAKLSGPLKGRVIRCSVGGLIMGVGFSLGPGSFGGLTLLGQPLLLPYAWVVMSGAYVTMLLGVIYLRSRFGAWIKTRRNKDGKSVVVGQDAAGR